MNTKNMINLLKAEGEYYSEGHKVMQDTGKGEQLCIAMCADDHTAETIAKLLTVQCNAETVLDNGDDGRIVGEALICILAGGDE